MDNFILTRKEVEDILESLGDAHGAARFAVASDSYEEVEDKVQSTIYWLENKLTGQD